MRRHHRNTIIAFTALVLTTTTASEAWANRSPSERKGHGSHGDERHEQRLKIRTSAIKLDRATSRLHHSAELSTRRASRPPTRSQELALFDLHCLEEATGRFRSRVAHRQGPKAIEREFDVLFGAFRTARRSFHSLQPLHHVEEHFYAVDRLIGELKWRIETLRRSNAYSSAPYYFPDRDRGREFDDPRLERDRDPDRYRDRYRDRYWNRDRDRVWLLPKRSRPRSDR